MIVRNPDIIGIKHIAFGVRDAEKTLEGYKQILGNITDAKIVTYEKSRNKVALFKIGNIEYQLCQSLENDGRFARWISRTGNEGLHHICYEVRDIKKALEFACSEDIKLRICEPCQKYGAHPHPEGWVAFLEYEISGVEVEFMQVYNEQEQKEFLKYKGI
tara:strand:+ start:23 stop:502 length:480 start_codon:yes stop_codon:yes gene_type:complete